MNNTSNNTGWIKIYRSILDWEWWSDRNTRDLFIYCLIAANHDTTRWKGNVIERGQFVTSLSKLSFETGLSVNEIRNALQHLISTHELTSETTNKYTIITICNYADYQDVEENNDTQNHTQATSNQQATNTQPTSKQQASHKQTTTNKNDKNGRMEEDNNIPPYNPPTGGTDGSPIKLSIPPTPDDVAAYCNERNNGIDPYEFIDYYDSCGWRVGNKPMKDWKAAIRTWENKRKAQQPHQQLAVGSAQSTEEKNGIKIPSELERAKAAFKF